MSSQVEKNASNFLHGISNNINKGDPVPLIRRMRAITPQVLALISKDPEFAAYLGNMLQRIERGNYSGISKNNFQRRAIAANVAVTKARTNAARENTERIQAANAERLKRTRNAAAAAARNAEEARIQAANAERLKRTRNKAATAQRNAAARNASAAAKANRAANRAEDNAETAKRAAAAAAAAVAAARAAAKKADTNARMAAAVAASRAKAQANAQEKATFDSHAENWERIYANRIASGRTKRQVIHNMAHQHLSVEIPTTGNITRQHKRNLSPNKGNLKDIRKKALRNVLFKKL